MHSLGATHKFRDTSTDLTAAEQAENLARLAGIAPALYAALGGGGLANAALAGRAALRCSSPDYLPIIGPVVDPSRFTVAYASLGRDATLEVDAPSPWVDGLYVNTAHGSRGLVTAPISGELLAAYLDDEPARFHGSVVGGRAPQPVSPPSPDPQASLGLRRRRDVFASSSFAIALRCTSSGPSTSRARASANIRAMREVVAHAAAAVRLDRPVDHLLRTLGHSTLIIAISARATLLPTVSIM